MLTKTRKVADRRATKPTDLDRFAARGRELVELLDDEFAIGNSADRELMQKAADLVRGV